jgi:outer membrane protein assembly factor BamE (lipoprotein component of BamABCDE complex)
MSVDATRKVHSLSQTCGFNATLTKRKSNIGFLLTALAIALVTGCAAPTPSPPDASKELTVGVVQKEIRKGMAASDVAAALGSPNIVTKDSDGAEVWIWDRIASEVTYSQSTAYGTILVVGGSSAQSSVRATQKTLTVIIKFDEASKVKSFSYHASKF